MKSYRRRQFTLWLTLKTKIVVGRAYDGSWSLAVVRFA